MFQNGCFGFKKGVGTRRNYFLLWLILKINRLLQLMDAKNVFKIRSKLKLKLCYTHLPFFCLHSPVSVFSYTPPIFITWFSKSSRGTADLFLIFAR